MDLRIIAVNETNYERALKLEVAKEQKEFIESVEDCLKEAKELDVWRPVIICDGETDIGFAMYGEFKSEGISGRVWLDRFLIDKNHQGKGYGKKALEFIVEKIFDEYKCNEIYLSLFDNNKVAEKLYKTLGFNYINEFDVNGENIMVIKRQL